MNKDLIKVCLIALLFSSNVYGMNANVWSIFNNAKNGMFRTGKNLFLSVKKDPIYVFVGITVASGCLYALYGKYIHKLIYSFIHSPRSSAKSNEVELLSNEDKWCPIKSLRKIKFDQPNTYNSGAAVKKGGVKIQRTQEDEIWSLFAGFREVCTVYKNLKELKMVLQKYGEKYPDVRCHIINRTFDINSEARYLVFTDNGADLAFLIKKDIQQNSGNAYLFAILLGYAEEDIRYYYKRKRFMNILFDWRTKYNEDKAAAQKYIQENRYTIREWAQENIKILYTWPES